MKYNHIKILTICFLPAIMFAQTKKQKDQAAIKNLCGCYEVSFNFSETFSYSEDENYVPSEEKHDKATEWVQLVTDRQNKIVLQHLLIVGPPTKPTIIKHWRQDWLFENTDFHMYNGNNHWKYKSLSKDAVRGQWTQKVYQVDDSPRYQGSATWVYIDGKSYWENTTEAPLPRREYSIRNDYNLTVRNNRHEITKDGWIHDQDNKKVIRKDGAQDQVIAEEKGYNLYKRVADNRCKAAQQWWEENHKMWDKVRNHWSRIFRKKQDLNLAGMVAEKPLYRQLFALDKGANKREINKVIDAYVR